MRHGPGGTRTLVVGLWGIFNPLHWGPLNGPDQVRINVYTLIFMTQGLRIQVMTVMIVAQWGYLYNNKRQTREASLLCRKRGIPWVSNDIGLEPLGDSRVAIRGKGIDSIV